MKTHPKPVAQVWIIRILLSLVVILVIYASYLSDLLNQQTKLYKNLENRYVRVRQQIGVKEMQRLIDQSYKE